MSDFGRVLLSEWDARVYGELDALQELVETPGALDLDEARAAAWVLIQRVRGLREDLARLERARAAWAAVSVAAGAAGEREGNERG